MRYIKQNKLMYPYLPIWIPSFDVVKSEIDRNSKYFNRVINTGVDGTNIELKQIVNKIWILKYCDRDEYEEQYDYIGDAISGLNEAMVYSAYIASRAHPRKDRSLLISDDYFQARAYLNLTDEHEYGLLLSISGEEPCHLKYRHS